MMEQEKSVPNPRRVAAGRLNRQKRRGFTQEGLEAIRQAAARNQPWRFSTGPRSPEGKAQVAQNGRRRQVGQSVREVRGNMAELKRIMASFGQNMMRFSRRGP